MQNTACTIFNVQGRVSEMAQGAVSGVLPIRLISSSEKRPVPLKKSFEMVCYPY